MKVFSILSSLLVLTPASKLSMACGFGPADEELRFMVMNPDLLHNKSWWSFFYNQNFLYLDGSVRGEDDQEVITKEWIKKTNLQGITPEETKQCIFGGLTDSALQKNNFYQKIKSNKPYFDYLNTALRCGTLTSSASLWGDTYPENTPKDQSQLTEQIKAILPELKSQGDQFFKTKYAFQVLKLAYYANDERSFNLAYSYFTKMEPAAPLEWWALHYKSMMLERQGKVDSANFIHARVFSHSSDKMLSSKQMFSSKNLPAVLELANNNEARADVLTLAAIINPGRTLPLLMEVFRLKPDHRHLPLLLSREVNKLEHWLGTNEFVAETMYDPADRDSTQTANRISDENYRQSVSDSLDVILTNPQGNSLFYNLNAATLQLLGNEPQKADRYLDNVTATDREVAFQKSVLQLISIVEGNDITSSEVQDRVGKIYSQLLSERKGKFESQKILMSLSAWLRYSFAQRGMTVMAGLFDNYSTNKFCYDCSWGTLTYSFIRYFDKYASAIEVQALINLYDKPTKNALEEILMQPYSTKNYFYDLLSVKHLREGNAAKALAALQQVPTEFWDTYQNAVANLNRDPFTENDELLTSSGMNVYTKLEIVTRMSDLQTKINQGKGVKQNAFLLANAWYNFSAHAWFMISYGITVGTTDNPDYARDAQRTALSYYRMALRFEKDAEQLAKINYMIALLDSNEASKKSNAIAYERMSNTEFYHRKNCVTTLALGEF